MRMLQLLCIDFKCRLSAITSPICKQNISTINQTVKVTVWAKHGQINREQGWRPVFGFLYIKSVDFGTHCFVLYVIHTAEEENCWMTGASLLCPSLLVHIHRAEDDLQVLPSAGLRSAVTGKPFAWHYKPSTYSLYSRNGVRISKHCAMKECQKSRMLSEQVIITWYKIWLDQYFCVM